ncbi:MAG: 30S ribosomal protein S5 [Metallosphaera yellowstonensis]|jgi:small subunit ribosomal protein S5|uniref:Small ribosomal subunit protein uS5 n=1 Tax=Metallosphaera yellowstonensis MK1 TaxID=671065 RepID=H2C6I3_9CREN|nr:30S ribosomal protein S5 [Metallosphaera yellowstonensis]EHP69410.1 ribosomal protein S5/S2 [Metallosphaera yellowstonensis MK1]
MEEVPVTNVEEWKPRTKVGQLVKEGKITSVKELFARNLTIAEPEIIDVLLPNLKYEVVDIRMVQKQTDAGELSRYKVLVVMGNQDGYVGIGVGKAKQLRVAIQKSIRDAKMHIIPVRRGCGSWECTCGESHSLPFTVYGKAGSSEIILRPAPKGTGLVAGDVVKTLLTYAGLRDVWSFSRGETRTTDNFIKAAYMALYNTYRFVTPVDWMRKR